MPILRRLRSFMHKRGDSNTSSITLVEPYLYRKSGYDDFVEIESQSIGPPAMVVRAIKTYQPPLDAPLELRITEGDFFHVEDYIDEIGDLGPWFDVWNPNSGERGLVPTRFVEEIHRSFKPVQHSVVLPNDTPPLDEYDVDYLKMSQYQAYRAIVEFEFTPSEGSHHELAVQAGETLHIFAYSSSDLVPDWLLVSRNKGTSEDLRPGLVPISHLRKEVRSGNGTEADLMALIDEGLIPESAQWQQYMANLKRSRIAASLRRQRGTIDSLHPGTVICINVDSFHREGRSCPYSIRALFQPMPTSQATEVPSPHWLQLYRTYAEVYTFQKALLAAFPRRSSSDFEATSEAPPLAQPIGTPLSDTEEICVRRQAILNAWFTKVMQLRNTERGREIVDSEVFRQFFAVHVDGGEYVEEVDSIGASSEGS